MSCSAVTLSLATIAAVVSVALLAIAFSTDNWIKIEVKRSKIQEKLQSLVTDGDIPAEDFPSNPLYFTRTKGLFRVCFPTAERPPQNKVALYLSPVETYCMNIDYYIPDDEDVTKDFSTDEMTKLHMGRAAIASFIVAFLFVFIAFWTGVAGCWRRSSGNITATAILMLLTCLFSAGGMGLWHGVEYYETEKISGAQYYKDWPSHLRDASTYGFCWSFYVSWISVGFSFVSALLFAIAATCLSREHDNLVSSQSQYLMTVYPQKQQAPGYPYGYAAYPPYAYAGTHQYPQYSNY